MSEIKVVDIGHPSAVEPALRFQADGTVLIYDVGAEEYVPLDSGPGAADFSNTATGTYTDGGINYKYKTYTGSGTLTFTKIGLYDILVVGAGGGGGYDNGGGGGAGRFIESTQYADATGAITITVGAGGAGGVSAGTRGASGGNSAAHLVTMNGGGGGGAWETTGNAGGSGGGGGNVSAGGVVNQTVGFGNSGGTGGGSSNAGGGGGAGSAGSAATRGTGKASTFSGVSQILAVGGGVFAQSNNTELGSGGNGKGVVTAGSAGIAGVVIIRVRTN